MKEFKVDEIVQHKHNRMIGTITKVYMDATIKRYDIQWDSDSDLNIGIECGNNGDWLKKISRFLSDREKELIKEFRCLLENKKVQYFDLFKEINKNRKLH